jgi:flavin reductase (DIM6/NTAB) family NADH-FMN oxidoreductase RutF
MRAFRDALSRFATGVAIVTAPSADGPDIGMTVSSLNSVSLDPPLLLFSVAKSALSLSTLLGAERFGINILSSDQQVLSSRFARSGAEKWKHCARAPDQHGAPLVEGAIAHFECVPYANYDGGDHVIFVVRVLRFVTPTDLDPLIFFKGKYCSIAELPAKI